MNDQQAQPVFPVAGDPHSTGGRLLVRSLGRRDYTAVWRAMQAFTENRDATSGDELWLVEHPPVFTVGLNGKPEHLLDPGDIPVVAVDRGGQVTYHGPGQIVAYPLLDLRRLGLGPRQLVMALEQAVIDLVAEFGVSAAGRRDAPGVYVNGAKIAALGLRVRRGCCYHGLSLNVAMDLEPFSRINPCGYPGMAVTQLGNLAAVDEEAEVVSRLADKLAGQLGLAGVWAGDGPSPGDSVPV
jgi:lipoyl(octanoyl) transferase